MKGLTQSEQATLSSFEVALRGNSLRFLVEVLRMTEEERVRRESAIVIDLVREMMDIQSRGGRPDLRLVRGGK